MAGRPRRDPRPYAAGLVPAARTLRPGRALSLTLVVIVSLFTVLVGRLGQVQLVEGPLSAAAAGDLLTREVTEHAQRGRILDREGRPLVDTTQTMTVTIERSVLLDAPDGGRALVDSVARALGRPFDDLWGKTMLCGTAEAPPAPACFNGSPYVPIPVARRVDLHVALALLERPELYPGVGVGAEPIRSYPATPGMSAAHLLGYVTRPTASEVAAGKGAIDAGDVVGRTGLEAQYDAVLRGRNGRTTVAIDPRGAVLGTVSTTAPTPGRDVRTHLDSGLQLAAEQALDKAVSSARKEHQRADTGAAVVLDVRSGAVLAAASYPTFDPSLFSGGISAANLNRLSGSASGEALRSRFSGDTFAPASTFKVVSTSAAVADGARLSGRYECSPSLTVGSQVFRNFESRGYGPISLHQALVVSCDTVFYRLGYAAWQRQGGLSASPATKDWFTSMARSFGLGARTGVDLPGEAAGVVPDRAWRRQYWEATRAETCRRARTGYPEVAKTDPARADYLHALARENCAGGYQVRAGDAINLSIGQGDLAVTPLQMAVAYAAVANGGTLWQPQVAAAFRSGDGTETVLAPHSTGRLPVAASVLAYIRDALAEVTRPGGSAGSAFAGFPQRSFPVAGKTGTGEVYGKQATAWFIGYGPTTKPRYVVAVVIGQGGSGSTVAAPAVRGIFDAIVRRGL